MASLQTLHLAHLPPDLAVHIALYTHLQNASFLRDQLLQGNTDFEYALIDASVIISTTHVLAAVFRAANDCLNGRLKSRNVHSEIVFSLGTNNNIAQSLRTFGITPTTTHLLAIKLSLPPNPNPATSTTTTTASSVSTHLADSVQGTAVPFHDDTLRGMVDVGKVRKIYKLGGGGGKGKKGSGREVKEDDDGQGSKGADEKERKELEISILGLMALRGAVPNTVPFIHPSCSTLTMVSHPPYRPRRVIWAEEEEEEGMDG